MGNYFWYEICFLYWSNTVPETFSGESMSESEYVDLFQVSTTPKHIGLIQRYFDESKLEGSLNAVQPGDSSLEDLQQNPPDGILVDLLLREDYLGIDFFEEIGGQGMNVPFVLLSNERCFKMGTNAFRRGFYDYRALSSLTPKTFEEAIRYTRNEYTKKRKLEKLARTDQLTDLLNRSTIVKRLHGELKRASRNESTSGLLFLDIDNFKEINDARGHLTGDDVLRRVSRSVRETIRDSDFAGRYGGDELLIVSPDTDLDGVYQLGERLLEQICDGDARTKSNGDVETACTVSIGCASYDGGNQENAGENQVRKRIDRADRAMYLAKKKGGGRVERRASKRKPANNAKIRIVSDDDSCDGELIDYSTSGLRIRSKKWFERFDSVDIRLNGNPILIGSKQIKGKIVWVQKGSDYGIYLAGLKMEQSLADRKSE